MKEINETQLHNAAGKPVTATELVSTVLNPADASKQKAAANLAKVKEQLAPSPKRPVL